MIKKVNAENISDYIVKYFSNYICGNNPFSNCIAYYIGEEIIGFIVYSTIYERAEIEYFAVDKDYRGKGISKKLFDYMLSDLGECSSISLEVRCDNERAVAFYLKNDFRIISRRLNYYSDIDGYLMIKMLR